MYIYVCIYVYVYVYVYMYVVIYMYILSGFQALGLFNQLWVAISSDWPQELLDAIFTVSQSMTKEICANLWVTCKKNGKNI